MIVEVPVLDLEQEEGKGTRCTNLNKQMFWSSFFSVNNVDLIR